LIRLLKSHGACSPVQASIMLNRLNFHENPGKSCQVAAVFPQGNTSFASGSFQNKCIYSNTYIKPSTEPAGARGKQRYPSEYNRPE
jgi:hypothetical protein